MTSCASRSACTARAETSAAALALAAVSLTMAASCSTPTDTQPYPGECEPLRVLQWTPTSGALEVPRDQPVSIRLDGYPDPDTVGLNSFVVTTGVFYHAGAYVTDLVDKTITINIFGFLRAGLGYDVSVKSSLRSLQ